MEAIINMEITVSMVVGVMTKLTMLLLLLISMVMIRQTTLMDKVIKLPVGMSIKLLVWSYFVLILLLTVIVIVA